MNEIGAGERTYWAGDWTEEQKAEARVMMSDEAMDRALLADTAGDHWDDSGSRLAPLAYEEGFEAGWRAREAQPPEDSSLHIVWAGAVMDERERGEVMAMALRLLFATSETVDYEDAWEKAHGALAAWEAAAPTGAVKETP